ncbi:saicar synthase-like protein [Chrysochromulina tobinii]|uniref:type II protein arginine methyltransferase n=1 Tax=Chrysochromulina tobinii TaxID=1460289 RepID=A0A0M0JZF9_9EUKA|nr:saicar synthase-like protein [Chrysochromulina tobinii]|eukprot:KOO31513.1 saicar synthase-like protein [Chrysochromulina sp. CCMP291]
MNGGEIGASASPDSSVRSEPETSEEADTSNLISAGHESFDLIFMMLLGIRTAISKFANEPQRELAPNEFDDKWDGDFLANGSADTPAHTQQDFRFRDFSPLVFRQIREHFGVTNEEYLLSLTSEYVLVEMFTNSKSGSFFYYSTDYRFILKTCTKNEAAFLIKALPRYHGHLMAHRYTLLCRFFGLHCVHLPTTLGNEVYVLVMGNVLPIDKPIHERYDLKGSTRGRITSEAERQDPNVVLKDLDWIRAGRKLHLGPDKKRVEQQERDQTGGVVPVLDSAEICPGAMSFVQQLCKRMAVTRGAALMIDYGTDETPKDSLRGILRHAPVHPLHQPGLVDLSVDVDFGTLRQVARETAGSSLRCPPLSTQRDFLAAMGLEARINALLKGMDDREARKELVRSAGRLVASPGMGTAYKVFAITHASVGSDGVAGFPDAPLLDGGGR